MLSRPPKIPAASLLRKGFHTRNSVLSSLPSASGEVESAQRSTSCDTYSSSPGLTGVRGGDGDPLFTVDALTGNKVLGDEQVLLALGDEDTVVLVRFEGDGSTTLLADTSSSCSTTSTFSEREREGASATPLMIILCASD